MPFKPQLYFQEPDLEELEEALERIREEEMELNPERDLTWGAMDDLGDCDE